MKTILMVLLIVLGTATVKAQKITEIVKSDLHKILPMGYELSFENASYTYYKKGEEVLAFSFQKDKLKSIVFTDKKLIKGNFESWKTGNGSQKICVIDEKDFIIVKNNNEFILFNKHNL